MRDRFAEPQRRIFRVASGRAVVRVAIHTAGAFAVLPFSILSP